MALEEFVKDLAKQEKELCDLLKKPSSKLDKKILRQMLKETRYAKRQVAEALANSSSQT